MKILQISDTHGLHRQLADLPAADVIVHCGDFTEAGTEDSLTRLRLAVASLSNSEAHLRSRMDKCLLMMEEVCPERMTDSQVEIYAAE